MKLQTYEKPQTIGVVIPAFNEGKNLSAVLDTVCAIPWFSEIVVVDDGSSDNTYVLATKASLQDERVFPVRLPVNRGKAAAMLAGVATLQSDLVVFLDADLKGLNEKHFIELCAPIQSKEYEMTIAIFQHGKLLTDASHRMTPYLTGQRCLRRNIAEHIIAPLIGTRFGVEMGITRYANEHDWRIQKVIWRGVTHHMKEEKRKGFTGIKSRWQMYSEILAVAIPSSKGDHRMRRRSPRFGSQLSRYLHS